MRTPTSTEPTGTSTRARTSTAERDERGRAARLLNALCDAHRVLDSTVSRAPRAMLVLAHQDDEVAGAGARLLHLRSVAIVHVTDGAPRDLHDAHAAGFDDAAAYAAARRAERAAALAIAAIDPSSAIDLDVPDQQASLALASLARRVAASIATYAPDVVITHPYEGGHPDHDATAFVVHAACALLRRGGVIAPALLEQTSYHARVRRERDASADVVAAMDVSDFLPADGCAERTMVLTREERAAKARMYACYATQQRVLEQFPIGVERFRTAPRYDFTRPPHEGRLWYEWFEWGMTGERWRELATSAIAELGVAP